MNLLERRSTFWFVAALSALLFGVTNLPWTLTHYDQAKQAYTSFEMVQEGHWLYQHTPNEWVATKPPLVGWVSAALYAVTRSWSLAWRLPSLLAAVALAWVLTRAATRAFGAAAGLLALGAFALNLLTPRLATLVRTDMPLALAIFLLGLTIWRKVRAAEAWQTRDRVIVFALLTATMLIKGPIVYAFLLPGIVAFQWWARKRAPGVSAWCGWWPWIASLAIFFLWVAGGIAWVPGFYDQVVLREFAGRFAPAIHRPQPWYFYFPHLLHKFAPWSLLIIGLAIVAWRARLSRFAPATFWLLCWSLGGLLIMSLVPSKRLDRIFPIVPPLCLLLAAQFAVLREAGALGRPVRKWSAIALVFACLFSGGYAAQKIFASYRANDAALVEFADSVRRQAAARGWRYEVIGGEEEASLLYLRRTHYLEPREAIARWRTGELDALVAPEEEAGRLLAALPDATQSALSAPITINQERRRNVLLTRQAKE